MKLLRTFSLISLIVLAVSAGTHADALQDAITDHAALNFAAAIPLYQVAIQQGNPVQKKQAEFLLACCYWSDQKPDDAANEFLTYAKDFPDDVNSLVATVHAADIRISQGNLTDADTLLNQVFTKGDPSKPDAYMWIGWANLAEGQLQAAEKNYTQAIPYLMKAIQKASDGRIVGLAHDSLTQCVTALQAAGQQTYAQQWLGESELAEGRWHVDKMDWPGAQPMLKEAIGNLTAPGTLGEAETLLARTYFETAEWTDCLSEASVAEQTLERDPEADQLYAGLLGRSYAYQAWALFYLKQYQQSVDKCEAMRSLLQSPDPGQLVESYICESDALFSLGRTPDTLALLNQFRASYNDGAWRARAGLRIANVYMKSGDYSSAIASLQQFISDAEAQPCDQDDKDALRFLLSACLLATGDQTGAKALLVSIALEDTGVYPPMAKAKLASLK